MWSLKAFFQKQSLVRGDPPTPRFGESPDFLLDFFFEIFPNKKKEKKCFAGAAGCRIYNLKQCQECLQGNTWQIAFSYRAFTYCLLLGRRGGSWLQPSPRPHWVAIAEVAKLQGVHECIPNIPPHWDRVSRNSCFPQFPGTGLHNSFWCLGC